MKILLTAPPKTGKSTLLKKLIDAYPNKRYGILAGEIRDESNNWVGFEAIDLEGNRQTFMHVSKIDSPIKVGDKYNIDVGVIDNFMTQPLLEGLNNQDGLIFIDEIGRAESYSQKFMDTVRAIFNSNVDFIATVVFDDEPWSMEFKNHPDVTLITLTQENRDLVAETLLKYLRGEIKEFSFK